ncbi:MAG: XRE family transcriptional regulator [Cyanobacteria bacterium P01_H01_bin.105]
MNVLQDLGLSGLPALDYAALDLEIAELEGLRIRTELMLSLQRYIQERQWTLEESARVFRQSSPRMQNLINGEISRFSMEDLVQMLTKAGLTVNVSVTAPAAI